ncbi:MAG: ScyD/ScyE family protein [Opitutus sp.]
MKTQYRRFHPSAILAFAFALTSVALHAETISTLTAGLHAPTKIAYSSKGNLLVTEAGFGPNSGRISIIDPATGARRTLLDGLPSGFASPNNDPSGPSALLMRGRTVYLLIGSGDGAINGPGGTQLPNPHPSSPILSSVLVLRFSANVEQNTAGFTLSWEDHVALKQGSILSLDNGQGDSLTVELLADFPDTVAEKFGVSGVTHRPSNPFGVEILGETLYVADASFNSIRTVDLVTSSIGVLSTFAPIPNTRGFGPPMVEAVPDSVHLVGRQLLVTLLTGGPFPLGGAQVRTVDLKTGVNTPLITGLTSAIDVLPLETGLLTLEFSTDMLAGPKPGRIQKFASPGAVPTIITQGLITPTSMVRDAKSGALFVTEIFTGRVVKVTP